MQGDAPVSGDHQSGQGEAGQRGIQGRQHTAGGARAGEDTGGEQEGSSSQEEGEKQE